MGTRRCGRPAPDTRQGSQAGCVLRCVGRLAGAAPEAKRAHVMDASGTGSGGRLAGPGRQGGVGGVPGRGGELSSSLPPDLRAVTLEVSGWGVGWGLGSQRRCCVYIHLRRCVLAFSVLVQAASSYNFASCVQACFPSSSVLPGSSLGFATAGDTKAAEHRQGGRSGGGFAMRHLLGGGQRRRERCNSAVHRGRRERGKIPNQAAQELGGRIESTPWGGARRAGGRRGAAGREKHTGRGGGRRGWDGRVRFEQPRNAQRGAALPGGCNIDGRATRGVSCVLERRGQQLGAGETRPHP